MKRRFSLQMTLLASALCLTAAAPAFAQSPADEATSRTLFEEARKLMDQGKFAEACPKLEEGQRLAPGIGMKFNLAECYERVGKLASAWASFLDVASSARAAGQPDREKVARRRAVALEPELLKIKVDVATLNRLEGLEVRRDGAIVGTGQWGTPIPADPGEHVVTATAPGRKPIEVKVNVAGAAGSVASVEIPLLVVDPSSGQKPTAVVAPPAQRGGLQRTIGWITSAVGLVGVGVGAGFGIDAMSKFGSSSQYCYPKNQCLPEGISYRDDARSSGNISTIAFVAGGAAIVAGLVLVLTAPTGDVPRTGWLAPGASGLGGRF
jgi:hypothetical protein